MRKVLPVVWDLVWYGAVVYSAYSLNWAVTHRALGPGMVVGFVVVLGAVFAVIDGRHRRRLFHAEADLHRMRRLVRTTFGSKGIGE